MNRKQRSNNKNKPSNPANKDPMKPKNIFGNIFFYIFLLMGLYIIFGANSYGLLSVDKRPISDLISLIQEGNVQDVKVSGNNIEVMLTDGTKFTTQKESNISFDQILENSDLDASSIIGKVDIEHKVPIDQIISMIVTFGLPLFIVFFIFRQMKGANNDIMSFGRSRARLFSKDKSKITFDDVAGADNAKTEMMEIVDFLKNPDKYAKLGARIPKGILLVGPSGVGKTLLAKAIAGEADVPFFSVAGSEFMEMLVGVGSARARDLFQVAKASQPSLIFIDEIDAIGRQRGMGIGGGHDEREQTLNQILIEMDGFDPRTAVIVLAATNRPDMLDPALIRPGRFDRRISIPLPDLKDREEIIKIHMRGKPFDPNVRVERIAKKTVGFSGADIENMLNESAILAAREGNEKISDPNIEEAALKVTLGSERKTLQTEEEREMTAYHEGGHALVAANLPDMDPVYRISIVARGASLGHTSLPPERDRYNETESRLISLVTTMLSGRAAEEIVYGELTVGAADDIEKATQIARKMVTEYGMSSLGPVSYDGKEGRFWVAKQMGEGQLYSEDVASKIDKEVKGIIDKAYNKSKEIISNNREKLDKIAKALMEKETLDQEEFNTLIST